MKTNPYAPPRTEVAVPVAATETGHGWRIENDKLLVRDGAALPEICILGGNPCLPVHRTWLRLNTLSGLLRRQEIRIDVFESRHTYLKRSIGVIGGILLGFAGGVASSILMIGDGSATPASISVSCFLIVLGILVAFWQSRHLPRITQGRDGWYLVESIAPGVLARLKSIRDSSGESRS